MQLTLTDTRTSSRASSRPRRWRWSAWLAALWLCVGFGAATAADVTAQEARQVRALIEAQLAAFAADDAPRAFSYAAPALRAQFGTPEHFMAMVRAGYPVVVRPASVSFLKPERQAGKLMQAVQMTDADGAQWLAVYELERQPDRAWRITGCRLAPNEGGAV